MLDPSVFTLCRVCETQTPQAALYCKHCWTFKAAKLGWASVGFLVLSPLLLITSLSIWKSDMQTYWALCGAALVYLTFYFKNHIKALTHAWLFLAPISILAGCVLAQANLAEALVGGAVILYVAVALVLFGKISAEAIKKGHSRWEVTIAVGSASLSIYFLFYEGAVSMGWLPQYGEYLAWVYWTVRVILLMLGLVALVVGSALRLSRKSLAREHARLNPITKLAAYTHAFVLELWGFTKETFGTFLKIQIRLLTGFLMPLGASIITVYLVNVCSLAVFRYMADPSFLGAVTALICTALFWGGVMSFSFLIYAADVHQFEELTPPYLQLAQVFFPATLNDSLILSWHLTYLLPATQTLVWALSRTFKWSLFSADFGYFSGLGLLVFIGLAIQGARRPNVLRKSAGA